MPVWHVSIARIAKSMDRIVPVEEWQPITHRQARELQDLILVGVGGTWQMDEIGVSALHRRRRLSDDEMRLLHQVNSQCPVFTHGEALKVERLSA